MIQKKKLNQFYIEEYARAGQKKTKNTVKDSVAQARVKNLMRAFRRARPYQTNSQVLEELHRQLKNVAVYAYRRNRTELIEQINTEMIPKLAALDLGMLLAEQREGINGEFLAWLRRTMPGAICSETLFTLYPRFRRYKVKNKILELVPARPEMEFAEVREFPRHFILHVGPTNSGKTFQALERLKKSSCGVYLGPLRLLALEVYERMNEMGVPCTMRTGQECIEEKNSRVTASTIEMADFDENYDIAHNNLGVIYLDSIKDYERALMCFANAVDLNPSYMLAHFNLGRCYAELNRKVEAATEFQKAIDLNRIHPEIDEEIIQEKLYKLFET